MMMQDRGETVKPLSRQEGPFKCDGFLSSIQKN